jgi:hypothetical protein
MRSTRSLVAAAALGVGVVGGSAVVAAQDVVPAGWEASTATVEGTRLHGAMERRGSYWDWNALRERAYTVTVGFTVARPPDLPAACSVPEIPAPAPATTRVPFDVTPPFECNGSYPVAITGTANGGGGTATLNRTFVVAMPAPAVTGVAVKLDGDAVDIRWDDMTAQAKDLTGYQVTRQVGTAAPKVVAEVQPRADGTIPTTARDTDLPDDGVLTYQVVAVRSHTGPGPAGQGSRAAITREGEPAPAPGDGPGTPGEGPGDAPVADGAGSPPGDGSAPATGGQRPSRGAPPRVGINGTFRAPALGPISPGGRAGSTTSTTIDTGFEEDLPYDPVDGPLEAQTPDDELAAFFNEDSAERGMAIPIATALVLAVWAFHLRVLARAARPTA